MLLLIFFLDDNKIEVAYDKQYRFRVIHAGAEKPLRVSIDDHKLRVFASDGYKFKYKNDEYPKVESIVLNPGERYDFFLKTFSHANVNRNPNYWIRVCMEEVRAFVLLVKICAGYLSFYFSFLCFSMEVKKKKKG